MAPYLKPKRSPCQGAVVLFMALVCLVQQGQAHPFLQMAIQALVGMPVHKAVVP